MSLCMHIYMCVHNHMHVLVDVHYIFEWMGTKIKYLKAGRGREEDKVKNQNLDFEERYVIWIGEVNQEEMESETDFDWVDLTQLKEWIMRTGSIFIISQRGTIMSTECT